MINAIVIFHSLFLPTQIAVIGDTQDRQWIFNRAIQQINVSKMTLMIHLGDLSTNGSLKWYRIARKQLNRLQVPYRLVVGNHDLSRITRKTWKRRWKYSSTYYSFRCLPYICIVLDLAGNVIGKRQTKWFALQLKKAKSQVLLFHHKALPIPSLLQIRQYWALDPPPYYPNRKFWKVLQQYKRRIKATFHGHLHSYKSYEIAGIKSFCSGGGGGKLTNRRQFFHWLEISLKPFKVKIRKIRRKQNVK